MKQRFRRDYIRGEKEAFWAFLHNQRGFITGNSSGDLSMEKGIRRLQG